MKCDLTRCDMGRAGLVTLVALSIGFGSVRGWCGLGMLEVDRVVAWGDLTYDLSQTTSIRAGNPAGLGQIAAGDFHSLALQHDGAILAWGDDTFGQTNLPVELENRTAGQVAPGTIQH